MVDEKGMGRTTRQLLFGIALLLLPFVAPGQPKKSSQLLQAFFVKPTMTQKPGNLGFNIIRIRNTTNHDLLIKPVLQLPAGWSIISNSIHDTLLAFGDSLSLPFRLRIPSKSYDKEEDEILFQCYSSNNQLLAESVLTVKLEIQHLWDVTGPVGRVLLLPNNEETEFTLTLTNRGNTNETLSLSLQPDRKLALQATDNLSLQRSIRLAPNADTSLHFKVRYQYDEERIFDIGKIQITATNGITTIYRSVFVEKYSDKYAPFVIDQGLMHSTESGIRTFSKNSQVLPFVKARGTTEFENDGSFKYNFTYYHLTGREDIIGNSYYNFLYTLGEMNLGLGAFSSSLGRNLYSRNSFMVSDKISLSPSSSIEGYASYGFIDRKTSAALGYHYMIDDITMYASAAYDMNFEKKINTASAILHTDPIKITKNQQISGIVYAYQERHYLNQKYVLEGLAYDLNYYIKLPNNAEFQLSNNYGTPYIPGPQMGLFNLLLKSKFPLKNPRSYLSSTLFNTERKYHQYNSMGTKMPYIYLQDRYANVFFHFSLPKKLRFYAGPSIEFYYSSKPSKEYNQRETFRAEKYRIECKAYYKQFLTASIKYGLGNLYYFTTESPELSDHDFHVLTEINLKGYGFQLAYDYGQMSNAGLYQYALDSKTKSMSVSPYVMRSFWNERVRLNLFSNFTYRFDLQYGTLNMNPRIETYLFNNWYAVAGGSFSYTYQNDETGTYGNLFYYMEFAIKKNWGQSKETGWKNDLKRLDVQMFKDDNGNGVKDPYENGVPNIKVRIKLTSAASQKGNLPVELTLVTNEKGIVSFNQIPLGFYDLMINPLTDMMEYFYIGRDVEKVELIKNKMLKIPFQKAHKLEGRIELKRQKFVKDGELIIDVTNIKVTAFNTLGNSYSAFTDAQGKFMLFVPGNQMYYVRISNVFGENFIILNNDIKAPMPETLGHPVVFQVVEKNRQINFKKVSPLADSVVPLQKIRVLSGKIAQGTPHSGNAFDAVFKPREENPGMQKGKFYVVLAEARNMTEAIRYRKIFMEQGLIISFGADESKQLTYVYTNGYASREHAQKEIKIIEKMNIKGSFVLKY